ncbi:ATP-dependent RNA helicase DDX54-like isoform X2 [Acipenser ruthenus]|uniref:ATP-dependent RNA helicase DDX54-like isoform X2 n=1 Tax=Acipenser ruthenus TaxID=7906 RepID=UPI002740D4A8|nr:ATP-dependent RNA helicase DDX54-like isoform X2 [Acipenser ruthenus]
MAQRKKRFTKKRRHPKRDLDVDSDGGEFELAAEVSDEDDSRKLAMITKERAVLSLQAGRTVPGFPTADCLSDVEPDTRELVRAQNKKKKKSGGFQSMGLGYPVYKGVMKKGYKVPTPIQRRTIPLILDGKDVVAMARTGSGKTAAFLIPMFERLKAPSAQTGARALILSPTRELALQTMKFTKELGKFCGFKTALILGGDRMDDQFAALHENPDIIIGTPGRLMHVVVEMNLKLHSVEYVVFDEADRLFEMGFAEQLQGVIQRLPENRQTVLFSATLPKLLVEFARAGLTEPVLIRLDVDTKLNDQLKLAFFHLRVDDKPALLLHLLRNVIKPQEQTVVFVATRHHVEYLKELLMLEGMDCAYIYSALDQTARKINIGKFVHRKAMVMIVTDVAARGIDIPMLDNVINYNFPSKAKLFLHRVGRVARAGRSGTAYSLVAPDEIAFVFDLHLFLGRPLQLAGPRHSQPDEDGVCGRVPQSILDDEEAMLVTAHENSLDLQNMRRISDNAYMQYLKSRPNPSPESVKRVKETDFSSLAVHPLLGSVLENVELERLKVVDSIKQYKSRATIFEINATNKTTAGEVMRAKRSRDVRLVDKFQKSRKDKAAESLLGQSAASLPRAESDEESIQNVFSEVLGGKRKKPQSETDAPNKRAKEAGRDEEFYIPYRPKDFDSERGLSMQGEGSTFEQQASGAVLDLMGDEGDKMNQHKHMMKWDRKKKRFVRETGKGDKKKTVRIESGQLVSKSFKKNFYEEWKKKYKVEDGVSDNESGGEGGGSRARTAGGGRGGRRGGRGAPTPPRRAPVQKSRPELKSHDQILKQRKKKQKQQFLQSGGLQKLRGKNQSRLHEMKRSGFGRGAVKKGKLRKRL